MNDFELLERLGAVEPPDLHVTARVATALEGAAGTVAAPVSRRPRGSRLRVRTVISFVVAVVVLIAAAVTILSHQTGLTTPITSSWQAGRTISAGSGGLGGHSRQGTWALVDDALSGTWQQNLAGPPPGYFTCADASTCFALSGSYASDQASTATSESLYTSTDFGSTWTAYPMPSGFLSTSPLACSDATDCAAGGTYNAQPVLVTTNDSGHSFTIDPLPSAVGTIYSLSCPSAQSCLALVARQADSNSVPLDATLLSTSDGGTHFSDQSIVAGDSMEQIDCSTVSSCTAIGVSDGSGTNDWTSGVAAVTNNGGQTWSAGAFPAGFGVDYLSLMSCADAQHCSVLGSIEMPIANSPQCSTIHPSPPQSTPSAPPEQSPAVRAISNLEYRYAMDAYKGTSVSNGYCEFGGNGESIIGDIASTSDGGRTWTPEQLPSDVPQPQLNGISCPSDHECWVSGSDSIPEVAGKTAYGDITDGGSPVLLGTTNAGSSWSRAIFSVPKGAPNFEGQSFLSAGFISCPSVNDCAANGTGAQGAPTAPVYSLRIPSNAT